MVFSRHRRAVTIHHSTKCGSSCAIASEPRKARHCLTEARLPALVGSLNRCGTEHRSFSGLSESENRLLACTLMGYEELAFNTFVPAVVLLTGFLGLFLMIRCQLWDSRSIIFASTVGGKWPTCVVLKPCCDITVIRPSATA